MDRNEAVKAIKKQNKKGRIATVWFQPVPYINAICSCETPQREGLCLRTDFELKALYKGEYLIEINQDKCQGCQKCIKYCQFGALNQ